MTELLNCPECDSGDVKFCDISVRPYCNECKYWAPVNWTGTKQDAIDAWNKKKRKVEGDIDGLFGDDQPEVKAVEAGVFGMRISMGETDGQITGAHDVLKAVQKVIDDREEFRKGMMEIGEHLPELSRQYAIVEADRNKLKADLEACHKVMRETQELLRKDGSIVDTVWSTSHMNTTLYELLEITIGGD